jgi:hypothetical protein
MPNPFPFTAGQVLTAAQMNSIGEAWTSYTPVIKGGATTVTATIQYAKYAQVNKLVFVQVNATVTSTGAVNETVSVSMPSGLVAVSQGTIRTIGSFLIEDAGTGIFVGNAIATGNVIQGFSNNVGDFMGKQNPIMTLVNNDKISLSVCYEVA